MAQKIEYKKVGPYNLKIDKALGKGAFGTVYWGFNENDPSLEVAAKVIPMTFLSQNGQIESEKFKELLKREISILQQISSPNIVSLKDSFLTTNNIYLIFEYCKDGDLDNYRETKTNGKGYLSESEAIQFFRHVCNGFKVINSQGIIHRDIKPSNILLSEGNAKIADFGFARFAGDANKKAFMTEGIGTPLYMAPEIFSSGRYSSKCDVWSLGILFYELLFGKTPWIANSAKELFENISKIPLGFPKSPKRTEDVKNLLRQMLCVNQDYRMDWKEVFSHSINTENQFNEKELDNVQQDKSLLQSMKVNARQVNKQLVKGNLDEVKEVGPELENKGGKSVLTDEISPKKGVDKTENNKNIKEEIHKISNILYYDRNIAYFLKAACHSIFCLLNNKQINVPEDIIQMTVFLLQKREMILMNKLFEIVTFKIESESIDKNILLRQECRTLRDNILTDYKECANNFNEVYDFVKKQIVSWKKNNFSQKFKDICNNKLENNLDFENIYNDTLKLFLNEISENFFNFVAEGKAEEIDREILKSIRFCQIAHTLDSPFKYFVKLERNSSQDFYIFYDELKTLEKVELIEKIMDFKI